MDPPSPLLYIRTKLAADSRWFLYSTRSGRSYQIEDSLVLNPDALLEIVRTKASELFGSSVIFFGKCSIDASVKFFSYFHHHRYNH